MRDRALFALAASVALAAPSGGVQAAKRAADPVAWRLVITDPDKGRLRSWRDAWVLGLRQARTAGESADIAREGVLLDPDAGLENAIIPDGDYDCRTIKLGRRATTGLSYMAYPAASCRIAGGRFDKLDGAQRPAGTLWAYDPTRLIFLGTMALGDEPRALDYGRDGERDMVGLLERIGPQRWRLVLPQPRWQSQVDVIELVPKASAFVSRPGGGG